MLVPERMAAFIDSFDTGNTEFLDMIEKEAKENDVPVIRKPMQRLLKFILAYHKPECVLEVGTATGFSAMLMKEYAPASCKITTIEKYDKRIKEAKNNFKRAGVENDIQLLEGDATEILKELAGPYDMIFMDAAKGQYINFYEDVFRLLKKGGLLVSDNVLQEGDIMESRFILERRNRTMVL